METINVAEAKSRFSELVSRASAGERFLIRRRERTVAVLVSPGEYERLERATQAAYQLALFWNASGSARRTRQWRLLACGVTKTTWKSWPSKFSSNGKRQLRALRSAYEAVGQ